MRALNTDAGTRGNTPFGLEILVEPVYLGHIVVLPSSIRFHSFKSGQPKEKTRQCSCSTDC